MFDWLIKRPVHDERDYLHMLRKLFPKGKLFGFYIDTAGNALQDTFYDEPIIQDVIVTTEIIQDEIGTAEEYSSSWIGKLFSVIATELARTEERAYDLARESVAGLSNEMLPEWYDITLRGTVEEALITSDEDKQRMAHGKIYDEAKVANTQFFVDYAATLGYTVTCVEDSVSSIVSVCGDAVCNDGSSAVYRHNATYGAATTIEITYVSGSGNLDLMKALFNEAKPAHVVISWIGF